MSLYSSMLMLLRNIVIKKFRNNDILINAQEKRIFLIFPARLSEIINYITCQFILTLIT